MHKIRVIFVTWLLCLYCESVQPMRILAVFPTQFKSHHLAGSVLFKSLAEAGHHITIISPHTLDEKVKNIKEIVLDGIDEESLKDLPIANEMLYYRLFGKWTEVYEKGLRETMGTYKHPKVTNLLESTYQRFDLVILDIFVNEALLGFGLHFNAPVIVFSNFVASKWTNDLVGSPTPLSYVPHASMSLSNPMTLKQRITNVLATSMDNVYTNYAYLFLQSYIYDNTFLYKKPTLYQLRRNVSLVLLNSHHTVNHIRPYVPNMIEVGGLHIQEKPHPLPGDLQKALDEAHYGGILFSMGIYIDTFELPITLVNAILNAFARLKLTVFLKWELAVPAEIPPNIILRPYFPQQSLLAHPKMKLFINQCGLLSVSEAVHFGIPVICIPMFADQFANAAVAEGKGYGMNLNFDNITMDIFHGAIVEVLINSKFAKAAKLQSLRYRDRPIKPLAEAIYWVEYIHRHKGAPHLHSPGQDLHWFEYYDLDVALIIILSLICIFMIIGLACYPIFKYQVIPICWKKTYEILCEFFKILFSSGDNRPPPPPLHDDEHIDLQAEAREQQANLDRRAPAGARARASVSGGRRRA